MLKFSTDLKMKERKKNTVKASLLISTKQTCRKVLDKYILTALSQHGRIPRT